MSVFFFQFDYIAFCPCSSTALLARLKENYQHDHVRHIYTVYINIIHKSEYDEDDDTGGFHVFRDGDGHRNRCTENYAIDRE